MRSDLALVRHVNAVAKRKDLHQGGGEKLLACKWDEFKVTDEDVLNMNPLTHTNQCHTVST